MSATKWNAQGRGTLCRRGAWSRVLLTAIGLVGCGPTPPTAEIDLVSLFDLAQASSETRTIDFGSQQSLRHLVEGFGPRSLADGRAFLWGRARGSVLRITIAEPRSLELALRGWPLAFEGAPEQRVSVAVNGRSVAEIALQPGPAEYRLPVPGDALRVGENRIALGYAWGRAPRDVIPGASESRELAVAWDWLRVVGARHAGEPEAAEAPQAALTLPFHSVVEYYLRIPASSALVFDAVEAWGSPAGASAHLEVRVEPEGSETSVFQLPVGRGSDRAIPGSPDAPARLVLRAVAGDAPGKGAGGLRLARPRLRVEPPAPRPDERERRRPPIVVYLIDALRADHVGAYGYARPTTPHIDAFAQDATLFEHAVAQSPWTRPSVISLFTGLFPQTHGINGREEAVSHDLLLLPERLRQIGYRTLAVVTNGNVSPAFGMRRGFDTFEQLRELPTVEIHQLSDRVNEVVFPWLEDLRDGEPFFLYLHTTDPHWPYTPRPPFRQRFAPDVDDPAVGTKRPLRQPFRIERPTPRLLRDVLGLYDAEIAFNDESFGALIEKLHELDLYARSLIVLVSDHGEGFYDHGSWRHGTSVFDEEIRIPFVVKFPEDLGRGARVERVARHVDLLPTLLDYLGEPIPASLQGRSLLPGLDAPREDDAPPTFAYLDRGGRRMEGALAHGRKLVRFGAEGRGPATLQLFDLRSDPRETRDVSEEQPIWLGYLRAQLDGALLRAPAGSPPPRAEIDDDLRRSLKALGYLP
jgi:arylsulfatase A-like enzyme